MYMGHTNVGEKKKMYKPFNNIKGPLKGQGFLIQIGITVMNNFDLA